MNLVKKIKMTMNLSLPICMGKHPKSRPINNVNSKALSDYLEENKQNANALTSNQAMFSRNESYSADDVKIEDAKEVL